jgi:hypothetical protein
VKVRSTQVITIGSGFVYRRVWLFAPLLFSLVGIVSFAQTVKIHLVNTANGDPIRNATVFVSGISGNANNSDEERQKLLSKHYAPDLRLETDANGETQLDLPNPAPIYFYIRPVLRPSVWDCTCSVQVNTQQVMQKGMTIRNAQDESTPGKFAVQPRVGEVVFRLKPTPWWVQVFWPLLVDH